MGEVRVGGGIEGAGVGYVHVYAGRGAVTQLVKYRYSEALLLDATNSDGVRLRLYTVWGASTS